VFLSVVVIPVVIWLRCAMRSANVARAEYIEGEPRVKSAKITTCDPLPSYLV